MRDIADVSVLSFEDDEYNFDDFLKSNILPVSTTVTALLSPMVLSTVTEVVSAVSTITTTTTSALTAATTAAAITINTTNRQPRCMRCKREKKHNTIISVKCNCTKTPLQYYHEDCAQNLIIKSPQGVSCHECGADVERYLRKELVELAHKKSLQTIETYIELLEKRVVQVENEKLRLLGEQDSLKRKMNSDYEKLKAERDSLQKELAKTQQENKRMREDFHQSYQVFSKYVSSSSPPSKRGNNGNKK